MGNNPVADFSCEECGEEYVCVNDDIGEQGMCLIVERNMKFLRVKDVK